MGSVNGLGSFYAPWGAIPQDREDTVSEDSFLGVGEPPMDGELTPGVMDEAQVDGSVQSAAEFLLELETQVPEAPEAGPAEGSDEATAEPPMDMEAAEAPGAGPVEEPEEESDPIGEIVEEIPATHELSENDQQLMQMSRRLKALYPNRYHLIKGERGRSADHVMGTISGGEMYRIVRDTRVPEAEGEPEVVDIMKERLFGNVPSPGRQSFSMAEQRYNRSLSQN